MRPMPVPIVRMFPLKDTDLMPQPEFLEGIFLTDWRVLEFRVRLAPHRVQLALLVGGQADVLQGVRQPLGHHLLHPEGVPAVDVPVQTDHYYLLCPVVVAETPHLLTLLALLLLQRPDELVAGDVRLGHLVHHVLGDPPEGQAPVPAPRHQELVVQPGLVEDPVVVSVLPHTDRV